MYDHLFPFILPLLKTKFRPPIVNKVAFISTATDLYIHCVPQLSNVVPLNKDYHS